MGNHGGGVHSVVDGGVDSVGNHGGVDSVVGGGGDNSVVGEAVVGEGGGVDSVVDGGVDGVDTVGNNSISSVKSVGGIGHHGGVGSEGLALGGAPVLSLVGLAHALVADLAVAVSVDWLVGAVVDGGDGTGHGGGQHGGVDSGVVPHDTVVGDTVVHGDHIGVTGRSQGETQESLHVCGV